MNVVIIDDERLARDELRGLLGAFSDVTVVGEAANVTEALRVVPKLRPDLVFLDIGMPGRNGFDFLAALPAPQPQVIFVTACDAFALRAFEVNAVDYLLKPVRPERLAAALARVRAAPGPEPVPEATAPLGEDDHVYVRDGERSWFLPVRTLRLLEAEGNHTRLYFGGEQALLYRTMAGMEARLPATMFFRANRSQLINLSFVEHVEPWFSGTVKVRLRGGPDVEFSRRQAQLFRERMSL